MSNLSQEDLRVSICVGPTVVPACLCILSSSGSKSNTMALEWWHSRGASRHSLQGVIAVAIRHANMEKLRPTQLVATRPHHWFTTHAKEVWRASSCLAQLHIVVPSPLDCPSPVPPTPTSLDKEPQHKGVRGC